MEDDVVPEALRLQIQQFRELDSEELEIEEVDDHHDSDENDDAERYNEDGVTFDTCLASLHTYLGEVEDTHHRLLYLESGAIVTLPLLYMRGVVLFPGATLPLRVVDPSYVAAVRRALDQAEVSNTIGVARIYRDANDARMKFSSIGTTAEIQQYRVLEDGSLNVVTRGRQRFTVRRRWIDVEGQPYGEVQIIQEDLPLKIPRDAFGKSPPQSNFHNHSFSHALPANGSHGKNDDFGDLDNGSEGISEKSFESELSPSETRMHRFAVRSCFMNNTTDESTSSDEDKFMSDSEPHSDSFGLSHLDYGKSRTNYFENSEIPASKRLSCGGERWTIGQKFSEGVPRAFWPHWVYPMHDSYYLAQRVAGMWKKIIGTPSMDCLVKKPDILSFYVASKIPVSESTRQELLEINGILYRLRREVELLERFDCVRCKNCQIVIARRSDMLVMSSEGPLGAYVNAHGFVHEIMTFYRATGLALIGRSIKEYSWFPGYSWTIANCATCESHVGWMFRGLEKMLKPTLFWGIRSSQVADNLH